MEFEDGTAATMVFNGYGYFDITELTWGIGEGGQQKEAAESHEGGGRGARQPCNGLAVGRSERGDIRRATDGLYVYTGAGREEVDLEPSGPGRREIAEHKEALAEDRPVFPDERWGMASLEVVLAILGSSRQRREVLLSHQVPCPF